MKVLHYIKSFKEQINVVKDDFILSSMYTKTVPQGKDEIFSNLLELQ